MRRFSAFIFLLIICLSLFTFSVYGEDTNEARTASDLDFNDELALTGSACYLVNLDTGRVVYSKNASDRLAPASTTKIMTAALALTLCDDPKNTVVTLPDDLWAEFDGIDISHAGLLGNEELTMEQLIYCMMLQSANEAASGIASYFGKEYFIEQMNDKARSLGCTNTNFTNPHGLYESAHYSSARDIFLITEWALSVPEFYEIASTARYELPETNKNYEKIITTTVLMQDQNSRYYTSYIKGIKTGTLDESGRCLVSTAEKNGMTFCLVLMGCPLEPNDIFWESGNSVFTETRIIYDWMFKHASLTRVVSSKTIVTQLPVKYSRKKDALLLYSKDSLNALLRKDTDLSPVIRYEPQIPEFIEAPVEKYQEIGKASVYADDIFIGEITLVSYEDIELSRFIKVISKIGGVLGSKPARLIYVLVICMVIFYVLYIFIIMRRQKKKQ